MTDDDYEQFMENGRRWRELLPEGRYAWPLYDWDRCDDVGPPLIGYAVYWRHRDGTLRTFLTAWGTSLTREAAKALGVANIADENEPSREGRLAFIVARPGKYAGTYGMHSGKCRFIRAQTHRPRFRRAGNRRLKKLG